MEKRHWTFIVFYEEGTQTVKFCSALRSRVQGAIDRVEQHDVGPASPDEPITDVHARQLGNMAFLQLAAAYPVLLLQITTKGAETWMPNRAPAFITFYDDATQIVKACVVPKDEVQGAIERAMKHGVGPESPDYPITDEHARLLGGMAYLMHAAGYPELRPRLQITTKQPVNWAPVRHPDSL